MRAASVLMLLALAPVALNARPAAPRPLMIPMCSGDSPVRVLPARLPTPHHRGGGDYEQLSCLHACHSGKSRKQLLRRT